MDVYTTTATSKMANHYLLKSNTPMVRLEGATTISSLTSAWCLPTDVAVQSLPCPKLNGIACVLMKVHHRHLTHNLAYYAAVADDTPAGADCTSTISSCSITRYPWVSMPKSPFSFTSFASLEHFYANRWYAVLSVGGCQNRQSVRTGDTGQG